MHILVKAPDWESKLLLFEVLNLKHSQYPVLFFIIRFVHINALFAIVKLHDWWIFFQQTQATKFVVDYFNYRLSISSCRPTLNWMHNSYGLYQLWTNRCLFSDVST